MAYVERMESLLSTKLPEFIGAAEYMSLLNSLESDPNKRMFTKDQILKTYYGYDKDLYPDVDVDVHSGGQPIYYYVISVE